MKNRILFIFPAIVFFVMNVTAQDFGFGSWDEDDSGFTSSFASPVKISGEVSAELKAFFNELDTQAHFKKIELGNIFRGSLDFSASGSSADAFINLKLVPVFDGTAFPVQLGEAYGRAYFGPVTLEAGLRKLSWGRADGIGPLDVINPLDYSDLSRLSDPQSIKIPRPMVHAMWNMGSFSRLEAVFVPWFQAHKFDLDMDGRWAPVQMSEMSSSITSGILDGSSTNPAFPMFETALREALVSWQEDFEIDYYDHDDTLRSAQAGLRFTTTVGSSDLGFQYYFGRLPRPAYHIDMNLETFIGSLIPGPPPQVDFEAEISLLYNYYHQIGVDFASVIAGFNTRAEFGANITSDKDGSDGSVYNPALVYSLGFDRDLFLGINLNLMANGSIRLFHDKMKKNSIDVEAGKDPSSTRITGVLSRKFLRDELELKTAVLWGIEDKDFLVMPSLVWSRNDISVELSAGFFGGDKKGELGQYRKNNYIRTSLTYSF